MGFIKNNYKKLVVLLIILLIYVTLCLRIYTRFVVHSSECPISVATNDDSTDELKEGDEIVQYVKGVSGSIQRVSFGYESYKAKDSVAGTFSLKIISRNSGELLATADCDTNTISSSPTVNFELSNILELSEPTDLELRIKLIDFNSESKIKLSLCDTEDTDVIENVVINGKSVDGSLGLTFYMATGYDAMSKISLIVFTLFGMLIIFVFYFAFISEKKLKLELMYLVCGIVIGGIFLLVIPEFSTPDEEKHIMTAYGVSNMIMGDEYKEYVAIRECDKNQDALVQKVDRNDYDRYIHALSHDYGVKSKMVSTTWKMLDTQKYLFAFPAVGITLGRLLHFGTVPTYLLGSIFNYALFMLFAFYAIKKIPFGKAAVMIICLLPMTLQQVTSYSYDCPIIAMSLVVIALSLKIALDEKISKRDIAVLIAVTILFFPVKGFAYAPILLIEALPLKRLFKENKKMFKWLIGGITAAVVIAFVTRLFTPAQGGSTSMNGFVEWADAPGYTIGYLISKPLLCLSILWDTITTNLTLYLGTLLGSSLGWLYVEIPWSVLMPFLIVLFFSIIKTDEEKHNFSPKQKIMIIIMLALSTACIMGAMLLDWTPLGYTIIQGIQGRYFLPLVLPLLFLLRSDYIRINKKVLDICIFVTVLMQPMVLFYIVEGMR